MYNLALVKSSQTFRTSALWKCLAQAPIALLLVCANCAAQDNATLYVANGNLSGAICYPSKVTILDNGKKVAQLERAHYIVTNVAPGHHVVRSISILKSGPKVEFDAVPGETYYLAASNIVVPPVCVNRIKKLPKSKAEPLIAKMTLQQEN